MGHIDCHAHYEHRILDAEGFIRRMDAAGIEKTALISLLTDPPETKKSDLPMAVQRWMLYKPMWRPLAIAITKSMYRKKGEWRMWHRKGTSEPAVFRIVTEPDNAAIAGVIEKHPDRFLGWIFVNPADPNAMNEIERWRSVKGMIGVKVHPFWHGFPVNALGPVAKRTEELGLPLLIHLGFGEAGDYRWLLERHPKLTVILAHLGIPYYRDTWAAAKNCPNVYFDLSSTYHVEEAFVRDAVRMLGPRRLLFGTDSPYAHDDSIERIIGWVDRLKLTPSDRDAVMGGNFAELARL